MHMSTFYLKVIASDKVFFEGKAEKMIFPAMDGEAAILAHHENAAIALRPGSLRILTEEQSWIDSVIGTGFIQIMNNRATLLTDFAERPEDVDIKRAQEALDRAQEQLRQKQSVREYYQTQAALARAMARLRATNKKHEIL